MRLSALLLSLTLTAGFVMATPLTAGAGRITDHQADKIAFDTYRAFNAISAVDTINTVDGINIVDAVASANDTKPASRVAAPVYDWPAGAIAVDLYMDGVNILRGGCAEIGGVIYVPVERFVDLCGSFRVDYTPSPEKVTVSGPNLSLTARVGDPYLTVNGRILYTGAGILSLRGWIFAPLSSMATAMGASLTVRNGWYQAYLTSGDPATVPSADQTYDSTDLYWLSRIISAEARGEPFEGQIAVGNVVLNRVRSREFPNTVKGVIFDSTYGIQFSPVANGTIYQTPTESAVMAAKVCLEGYSLSDRALYFFNPALATSSWIRRTRTYLFTIGGHAFYA